MTTDLATLQARLADAEAAYHKLMLGSAVVVLKDQNGESVTYQSANSTKLAAYIASLKQQIAALLNCGRATTYPMGTYL